MLSTVLLLVTPQPSAAATPCATPAMWEPVDPEPLAWRGPGIDKAHRDPYGAPQVRTSEHFAVRFGEHAPIAETAVDRLLNALETAWDVQIDELGHAPPYGTSDAYFNVYIGDSDPALPPGHGAAGYYTADRQGWPMIVVAAETLERGDYADITAAHELYHAVQGTTRRFAFDPDDAGAWFWEASATWASSLVYPDNVGYSTFLGGYALQPHRRLDLFGLPGDDGLDVYHPYGAFVFLSHVARAARSPRAVAAVWKDDGTHPDPLEVLRDELADRGHDLDSLWLDHIARNVTWDYPEHELFTARVEGWAARFPEHDLRVTARLDGTRPELRFSPERSQRPERYGANNVLIERPAAGTWTLAIDGQPFGVHGHAARYGATVVIETDRGPRYRPVPFEHGRGRLVLDDLHTGERAWVVIGAWTPEAVPAHLPATFPYTLHLSHEAPPDPRPPTRTTEATSGGCDSAGQPAAPVVAAGLAWVLLLSRRRRGTWPA